MKAALPAFAALALAMSMTPAARAAIVISEVAPYASGSTTYAADWFELTNAGSTAQDITGWRMDDNSNSFAASVAIRGLTSIGAGQSAIFLEGAASGSGDAALDAAFITAWFNGAAPAGFLVGNYGGSGVGLSTSGDAVNIFTGASALVAHVDFGNATTGDSFDNTAGLNNATISQLSVVGVNGAFVSFNGAEIGSPGVVSAVPEPTGLTLMLAGLGVAGFAVRRRSNRG